MRPVQSLFLAAVAVTGMGVGAAQAATITPAGLIADNAGSQVTRFATPSVPKTLDGDGDNVYGTLGNLTFGFGTFGNITYGGMGPGFHEANTPNYAQVDIPGQPGASPGGMRTPNTTTQDGNASTQNQDAFFFTVNPGSPANFRVGIALGGLDDPTGGFNGNSVGLRQTDANHTAQGSSAETSLLAVNGNNIPDMAFFDVIGAVPGDIFAVFGDPGTVGNNPGFVTQEFLTTDALLPEPASLSLLGLGAIGLLGRRRRTA